MTKVSKAIISTLLFSSVGLAASWAPVNEEHVITSLEGSLPEDQENLTYKPLEEFEGNEDQCTFVAELESTACFDGNTVYLDSGLLFADNQEFKIGGSIGQALGQVTNPIRDNVTAPIGKGLEHLGGQTVQQVSQLTGIPEDRINCVLGAAETYFAGGQCGAWTGATVAYPYVTAFYPVAAATCYRTVESAKGTVDTCRWLKP